MGAFPSGQRGQTVNLLHNCFGGPNPPAPTKRHDTIDFVSCLLFINTAIFYNVIFT